MQFDQVDVESRVLHIARLKKGLSTTHPLRADELRVIEAWLAESFPPRAYFNKEDSVHL